MCVCVGETFLFIFFGSPFLRAPGPPAHKNKEEEGKKKKKKRETRLLIHLFPNFLPTSSYFFFLLVEE